jgi:hypothetical protein
MNEGTNSKAKETTPAKRKVGAPQFNMAAFAHRLGSQVIHDYKKKQRSRAKNKVAARSRTANRGK